MADIIARLDDVTLAYGDRVILKNCSLDIVEGAITCIIGLSGAGKSTILRLLDGLSKPNAGHVYVRNRDICHMPENQLNDIRRSISMSFQFAALLDSLTVGENVALPLRENTSDSDAKIVKTVEDALESVGLGHTYDSMPSELSGGMLKRAGFARAIVTRPDLILYDEPTTGLDPIVTHLITDTIIRLRQKLNGSAVVISHDLQSIYTMSDYVAMLFEGAVIAYGTVDEIKTLGEPHRAAIYRGQRSRPDPHMMFDVVPMDQRARENVRSARPRGISSAHRCVARHGFGGPTKWGARSLGRSAFQTKLGPRSKGSRPEMKKMGYQ